MASGAQVVSDQDWATLAAQLKVTPEEAVRRAFRIASFVAKVDEDPKSKLILKKNHESIELTLKP